MLTNRTSTCSISAKHDTEMFRERASSHALPRLTQKVELDLPTELRGDLEKSGHVDRSLFSPEPATAI